MYLIFGVTVVFLHGYHHPIKEVIKRLSEIGYDGVEIGCAAPHAWPYYLNDDKCTKIKKVLKK